jgi:hypothetical protein
LKLFGEKSLFHWGFALLLIENTMVSFRLLQKVQRVL